MIIRFLRIIFLSVFVLIPLTTAALSKKDDLVILYFFSSKCPHCMEVKPLVLELSKTYRVLGYYPHTENRPDMPFPTEPGRRDLQKKYDVPGVPSMIILGRGMVKQKLVGSTNIGYAPALLQAFKKDALTVSETSRLPPGSRTAVAGILRMEGGIFGEKKAVYYLTDGAANLPVRPWLPAEAVKSRLRSERPRLMSDVVNRAVFLKGRLERSEEDKLFFLVSEEVRID